MEAVEPLLGRTLVIAAHPDDETLGCGALLQRMRDPVVVFCTDGAPRDRYFWNRHGSREAYAQTRRAEARSALDVVGRKQVEFLPSRKNAWFLDQDLYLMVADALQEILRLIQQYRPDALLSHAYEGGHPDHDVCCYLATAAARERGLPAWEFPLYHRAILSGMRRQQFMQHNGNEVPLEITKDELACKRRMQSCYASQRDVLSDFDLSAETFRPMDPYNFSLPPHAGPLNYEVWGWPVAGAHVCAAFDACRTQGTLPSPPPHDTAVKKAH